MKLTAQWIVGFTDGEGCFHIGISNHSEMTTGVQVLPEFTVVQHKRDIQLLHALKAFFGCGVVRSNHAERMAYRVRSLDHLQTIIIPFFEKHELKSKKRQDFILFRKVVMLMNDKQHLTQEGLVKVREIAEKMNVKQRRESPTSCESMQDT